MKADPNKPKRFTLILRHRRAVLLAAGILALAAVLGGHFRYRQSPVSRHPAPMTPKPSPHLSLKGVKHTISADGRKQLEIRFDAIRIQKGKLGLLRFGLFKEAVIDNAQIDIYRYSAEKGALPANPRGNPASESLSDPEGGSQGKWPRDLFSKELLTSMSLEGIRALSFKPAVIKLFENDRLVWRITAGKAVARHRPPRIDFSGNVTLWRPSGTMQTKRLTLSLENGAMTWPNKARTP